MNDALKGSPPVATVGMVKRGGSGLYVSKELAGEPDKGSGNGGPPIAYDPDGRRRVVMTQAEKRKINDVIHLLRAQGFGIIVGCVNQTPRADGKMPCGGIALPEDQNTPDPGFGCGCSRIHWTKE